MATENKNAIEATSKANSSDVVAEEDVDRALLRKVDWHVMPVVSLNCRNIVCSCH